MIFNIFVTIGIKKLLKLLEHVPYIETKNIVKKLKTYIVYTL